MKLHYRTFYYLLPLWVLVFIFGYKQRIHSVEQYSMMSHSNLPIILETEKSLGQQKASEGVSLLHFWASWCSVCQGEHPFLLWLKDHSDVPMYGIDFRDDPYQASQLLAYQGNPYAEQLLDNGQHAAHYGIHAVPQTLVIDGQGRVRYRHIGPMNQSVWENKLLPIIQIITKE